MKYVKITRAERRKLERQCNNLLNWSDGGHWLGRGQAPNCSMKEYYKSFASHTYTFPTDASATQWNVDWEEAIRTGGHVGTAVLTIAVAKLTSGTAGIAVGVLASIFQR